MVGIREGIKLERNCLNEPTPVRLQTATARWQLWKLGPKLMCGELDLTGEKDCFSYPSHKGLQRDSGEGLWSPADEIKPPKTKPRDASFPSGASYYPPILPAGLSAVCSALSPVSPSPVTSLCCRAPLAKGTGSPQRLTEHPPRHSPSFRESKEHQQSPGEQLQCSTCWFGAPAHCPMSWQYPNHASPTWPVSSACPQGFTCLLKSKEGTRGELNSRKQAQGITWPSQRLQTWSYLFKIELWEGFTIFFWHKPSISECSLDCFFHFCLHQNSSKCWHWFLSCLPSMSTATNSWPLFSSSHCTVTGSLYHSDFLDVEMSIKNLSLCSRAHDQVTTSLQVLACELSHCDHPPAQP